MNSIIKCKICNGKTTWYGWLHGWLCAECDAQIVNAIEEVEGNDNSLQQQKDSGTGRK
jgi:hypothetical protein